MQTSLVDITIKCDSEVASSAPRSADAFLICARRVFYRMNATIMFFDRAAQHASMACSWVPVAMHVLQIAAYFTGSSALGLHRITRTG